MRNRCLHLPILCLLVLCLRTAGVCAQTSSGTWSAHYAYRPAQLVAVDGNQVYCAQRSGLFVYDAARKTLTPKSKADGLSDAGISAMGFDETTSTLVVGYENGGIDLLSGRRLSGLDVLKSQQQYVDKRVRQVFCHAGRAYLACSFGILAIDLKHKQLLYTCLIGGAGLPVEVTAVAMWQDRLCAATAEGLKVLSSAAARPDDHAAWQPLAVAGGPALPVVLAGGGQALAAVDAAGTCHLLSDGRWTQPLPGVHASQVQYADGSFYVTAPDRVCVLDARATLRREIVSYRQMAFAPRMAVGGANGAVWIADEANGLVEWREDAESAHVPDGPASLFTGEMQFAGGVLYAAGGGADDDGGEGRSGVLSMLSDRGWSSLQSDEAQDFVSVAVSPADASQVAVASWGTGVLIYRDGRLTAVYNNENSPLEKNADGVVAPSRVRYDKNGNLWVTQAYSRNPVVVLSAGGAWQAFDWPFSGRFGRLFFDNSGRGWLHADGQGLFVFDIGGTLSERTDDRYIAFHPTTAYYETIGTVHAVAQGTNGQVWAGTESGPVLYADPASVLSGQGTSGSHVLVAGQEEPDKVYPLLGAEPVLSVAVDGANRKWFGTATSGVFLISSDNKSVVQHFTAENSPLPDNRVTDICLSDVSSEVFFNTPLGMVSYRSDAVTPAGSFEGMYVYPNPVRPEYDGEITVTGLMDRTDVRITDVSGRLVYRTTSSGGQVVWNGKTAQGRRPATGVYIIFCTSSDGSETATTKLLFVK